MRDYPDNMPNPEKNPEGFNQFLRDHNDLIEETEHWILIYNSYEVSRLVLWHKLNISYKFQIPCQHYKEIRGIMKEHRDNKWWVNATADKSVPNRFHYHIQLI